jgi:cytochrome c553
MFHIKNKIAAGLALIVFLTSSTAFAEGDSTAATAKTDADTVKSTQKKPAKKKRTKAAPKSEAPKSDTPAPTSDASAPPKSDIAVTPTPSAAPVPPKAETRVNTPAALSVKADEADSAEAIKQRSGPGDPVAGKEKSELCQGCHGEEGVSTEPNAPKLAGQYGAYIAKELRNFQAGTRVHKIMSDIAATVSDDDLADISAYFASRKKMKGNGSENKAGQELFLHGDMSRMMVACVNCHGVNGKGKTPTNPVFPVIGGQHKEYLRVQLINFRAGDRSNSPGGIMNIITQKLTDAELDALADYISGL